MSCQSERLYFLETSTAASDGSMKSHGGHSYIIFSHPLTDKQYPISMYPPTSRDRIFLRLVCYSTNRRYFVLLCIRISPY